MPEAAISEGKENSEEKGQRQEGGIAEMTNQELRRIVLDWYRQEVVDRNAGRFQSVDSEPFRPNEIIRYIKDDAAREKDRSDITKPIAMKAVMFLEWFARQSQLRKAA